jgi:hypothetical protein
MSETDAERRQTQRHALARVQARVTTLRRLRLLRERQPCIIDDLSRSGLGITTASALRRGAHVLLEASLPGIGPFEVSGRVQYVHPAGEQGYRLGILFDAFEAGADYNTREVYQQVCAFEERLAIER